MRHAHPSLFWESSPRDVEHLMKRSHTTMRIATECATCVLLAVISTSAAAYSCQAINDSLCASSGYTGNTTFPNVFNQSEQEAKLAAGSLFYLSFIRCSSRINQFLCSAFYPTCNPFLPSTPIEPCLEFCVQVRDECLPLLRSYGYPWPNTLDCDRYFTSIDKNPLCSLLLATEQPAINQSNSSNCTSPAHIASRRTFVMAWVATCTFVYVVTTAIIALYFSCTRTSDSLVCAIISITSCSCLAAVAYCVSVATAARNPNPACIGSGASTLADYRDDSLCVATFGIAYYCTFCTWSWWIVLTFQWLARGLNAKFSRQKRTLVLYHLFSWLVPTPFLAACMAAHRDLVVDPVMGVCSLRKNGLLTYLIIPLFVTLALCCLLTLLAHTLLLRHKVHTKTKPYKDSDGVVLRAGLYTPMCFLVQSSLLLLYSYEYWYTPAPASNTDTQLSIDVAKFTVTIVINITTLAWMKTKVHCSCYRSTTLDFLTCDLPTLSQTSTMRSMKETSV